MNPATSSVIAGIAGKASLVIGVLGLGVGTAAAAGADVPLLTPTLPAAETTSTTTTPIDDVAPSDDASNHGRAVSEVARSTGLDGCAKGEAVSELASRDTHVGRDCEEPSVTAETSAVAEQPSGEPSAAAEPSAEPGEAGHGQLVSEFARTTELEGCAKGQAVAELASGGNHIAKDCGDEPSPTQDETETEIETETTVADGAAVPTPPGNSGDAPGRSGEAPGRSGDAPKGGNRGANGNGRHGG